MAKHFNEAEAGYLLGELIVPRHRGKQSQRPWFRPQSKAEPPQLLPVGQRLRPLPP